MSRPPTPRRTDRAERADDAPSTEAGPFPGQRSRQPYRAPRLVVYGRLTEITQFGGSQVVDSGGGLGSQP